jgi:hypothetical protein
LDAVEKPDGMRVPDLVLGIGQTQVDLLRQQIADGAVACGKRGVVLLGVTVHGTDSDCDRPLARSDPMPAGRMRCSHGCDGLAAAAGAWGDHCAASFS